MKNVRLTPTKDDSFVDLEEVYDGFCDVAVVNFGAASAFGVALDPAFKRCMSNNLLKFAAGHSFDEFGKLVKPLSHPKLELLDLLIEQGYRK